MHVPHRVIRPHTLKQVATSTIPTRYGDFQTHVFLEEAEDGKKEHLALVYGEVAGRGSIPLRVHSECMTSEVFGSLKCDCKQQLEEGMRFVAANGAGAILYLRQEGRGIGLTNKIRAYELQARGHDTVDANRLLGLPDDAREYHAAAGMIRELGITSVLLLTNNPAKTKALSSLGIEVAGRIPVVVQPNPFSRGYLETKRERMAHALPNYDTHVACDAAE